jgi:hypothetical protein
LKDLLGEFIAIYVFNDNILIEIIHKESVSRNSSDSELYAMAKVATKYFHSKSNHAINVVKYIYHISEMLGKSLFKRRLHGILELITDLFFNTAEIIRRLNISSVYIIEHFPVAPSENIPICYSKLSQGRQYTSSNPSIREEFFGSTVQINTSMDGIPIEFEMLPDCYYGIDGMKNMILDLLEGRVAYCTSRYTDNFDEQSCNNAVEINLMIARKDNTMMPHETLKDFLISDTRKSIGNISSQIFILLQKRIHPLTEDGFLIKVILFIFVFTLNNKLL